MSTYKKELLELFKDGKVKSLSSSHPKLYATIRYFAQSFYKMEVDEYITRVLGLEYSNSRSSGKYDSKTLEYLMTEFESQFSQVEITNFYKVARDNISSRIRNKKDYTGNWIYTKIEKNQKNDIIKLIDQNEVKYSDYDKFIRIYTNKDGHFAILYLVLSIKLYCCFIDIDEDIKTLLEEKKYFTVDRDEYIFMTDIIKNKEIFENNYNNSVEFRNTIQKFSRKRNLSIKEFLNEYKITYYHPNIKSDIDIKNILNDYIIESPNRIHIPISDWSVYCSIRRLAKRRYSNSSENSFIRLINELGFEYSSFIDRNFEEKYKKIIEEKYLIEKNIVYINTQEQNYYNLISYAYRNELKLNDLLLTWGYQRIYSKDLNNYYVGSDIQEIDLKTSDWVLAKSEFGFKGEKIAYKYLQSKYSNVKKVDDYQGYDFLCCDTKEEYLFEVKTISKNNFRIHLSRNQLNTMKEQIDNYNLLIVNIINENEVKIYHIPNPYILLGFGENSIYFKKNTQYYDVEAINYEFVFEADFILPFLDE